VAAVRLRRERDVLQGAEVLQYRRNLVGAREPHQRALVARHRRDVLAFEIDLPGVGQHFAYQLVDQRRFSRSVGTDDRVQLAALDFEVDRIAY
jgi:hypothetical protein